MVKQDENRKEEGYFQSANPRKAEYVEIELTGTSTSSFTYISRGVQVLTPGSTKRFNVHDKEDLHHLLGILKSVNSRANVSRYIEKNAADGMEHKQRKRFTVKSGLEYLPPLLQKVEFEISEVPTDEQRDAILSLCPDYFEQIPKARSIPM